MLRLIEEYGKYVEITGFRHIKIENVRDFLNSLSSQGSDDLEVQLYNADLIATWQHLYFAAINALMAFKTHCNTSKTLALETVLYASAQRQINKALELIGIRPHSKNIALLIIGKNSESVRSALSDISKRLGVAADETVLDLSEAKNKLIRNAFEISEVELDDSSTSDLDQRLLDLIIERIALHSTKL